MSVLDDAKMYARFALGLRKYLSLKITPEQARALLVENLARREANFLAVVKKAVFDYSRSPYLPLLKSAGCEYGDLERLVQTDGLTEALSKLREAGVYVSFDEFKGRQPIERGSLTLPVRARDFDNPFVKSSFVGESGGSTGAGTRIGQDLDHRAARVPVRLLAEHFHDIVNLPRAMWYGTLPSAVAVNRLLDAAVIGNVPRRWFAPMMAKDRKHSLKHRLANEYFIRMCRFYGVDIPKPEPVPLDRADIVARWAADTLKSDGRCVVNSGISMLFRVAIAAKESGLDLTGAVFHGSGEPPTPAKVKAIDETGARLITDYHLSEANAVGIACTRPIDSNDQHLLTDHLEIIQCPRKVPGSDIMVDAFTLTSLLATSPKLFLNVEIDDYGIIEQRSCGCPWDKLGFTTHVREIRSYRKLTGEGMTLVGSEMEKILDEVLPAKFGGSPQDYQLHEEEDERGFTIRSVVISPSVSISDEAEVIRTVLDALGRGSSTAEGARILWTQAKSLRVKRVEPVWTSRGKLMPLHLAARTKATVKH